MTPSTRTSRRGVQARRRLRLNIFRGVVLTVMGLYFLGPIGALIEFSTRGTGLGAPRTLASWRAIPASPGLTTAITVTLELATITAIGALVLMVPTMVWVRLRVPWLDRTVEFLCLLPLTIPAIALVVGLGPLYLWVTYLFGSSTLTLCFAYVVLVLPYVFRSLDAGLRAIDVRTLSEAARGLGASWTTVIVRVIVPNISSAVVNAALLAVSIVLGEFTIASLLQFDNLQTSMNALGQADVGVSVAVAAAALIFIFFLLLVLSFVGRRPGGVTVKEE